MFLILFVAQLILILDRGGKDGFSDLVLFILPATLFIYLLLTHSLERVYEIQKSQLLVFVLLVVSLFVSTVFSQSIIESSYEFFRQLSLLMIFIFFLFDINHTESELIQKTILVAPILTALLLLFTPTNQVFVFDIKGHNNASEYLIGFIPLALYLYRKKHKTFAPLVLLILFAGLVVAQSRVSLFLATIFILTQVFTKKMKTKWSILLLIVCLMLITILFGQNQFQKSWNLDTRVNYWASALIAIPSRLLFGHGPNTYSYHNSNYLFQNLSTTFSHNFILDFLFENGLVYTLLFFLLFFLTLRPIIRKTDTSSFQEALLWGLLLIFANSLFDAGVRYLAIFFIVYVFLGLLVSNNLSKIIDCPKVLKVGIPLLSLGPSLFFVFVSVTHTLDRNFYRREITKSVIKSNPLATDQYIRQWESVDRGNSKLYLFLSDLFLSYQLEDQSYNFLIKAINAPFYNDAYPLQSVQYHIRYLLNTSNPSIDKVCTLLSITSERAKPSTIFEHQELIDPVFSRAVEYMNQLTTSGVDLPCFAQYKFWRLEQYLIDYPDNYFKYLSFSDNSLPISEALHVIASNNSVKITDLINKITVSNSYQNSQIISRLYWALARLSVNPKDAVSNLKNAISYDPNFANNYIQLAVMYHGQRQDDLASNIIEVCSSRLGIDCLVHYKSYLNK